MKKTLISLLLVILLSIIGIMGVFINALVGDMKQLKRDYDVQVKTVETLKEANVDLKDYAGELKHQINMMKMFERN